MRKLLILIAAFGLLLSTSCGRNERAGETTDWTPLQIAQAIWESQSEFPAVTAILAGDELYDSYVGGYYRFDLAEIADGAIFCADAASAQEIAVLRLADGADVNEARQTLSEYSRRRIEAFTGYLPDEAALAENATIAARGDVIALLICRETDLAEAAFQRAFTEAPPETVSQPPDSGVEYAAGDRDDNTEDEAAIPGISHLIPQEPEMDTGLTPAPAPEPETGPADTAEPEPEPGQTGAPAEPIAPPPSEKAEDIPWKYDSARLLSAWRLGDWSGLTQQDQAILDVCQAVIGQTGFGDLSDYEKELTVHDWMLANGSYDTNRLSNLPQYQENPDNDNPYGFLVGGVGICRGYTATFQLFMDLLGIECISVQGQANSTRNEHTWNMVRLDGEWYCVDVTWDDPVTELSVSVQTAHRYFNVTSEFMRFTGHYWDESSIPEASGIDLSWDGGGSKHTWALQQNERVAAAPSLLSG